MRRFYCENCGAEVAEDSDICPECGAFFVAIKCPRCNYRGKAHEFRSGCPRCGYLGPPSEDNSVTLRRRRTKGRLTGFFRSISLPSGTDYKRAARPPRWLFWMVLFFLAVSFLVLARVYVRL